MSPGDPDALPPHPWAADRELTEETVRSVVRHLFPRHAEAEIAALGHGWDFDAYQVGDTVLRFPRRATVGASLGTALATARRATQAQIADLLAPFDVSVPLEEVHEAGDDFPYPVAAHVWIEGVALDETPAAGNAARRLGEVLTMLHSGPGPEARALPIETDNAEEWLAEARALADVLPSLLGQHTEGVMEWLLAGPRAPEAYTGPVRFLHDDLSPDHVLVDPGTGRLVGIIDWSDAAWGDPALDFVVLRAAMGAAFTDAMVEAYTLPVDSEFRERIDFMARVESLKWLHHAHRQSGDVEKHRRWVQSAFSG